LFRSGNYCRCRSARHCDCRPVSTDITRRWFAGGTGVATMGMEFTPGEIGVLYRLLAESTANIILKTDRAGFIVHAAPDLDSVGLHLAGGPIGRHLLDLVHPSCAAAVMGEHAAAIAGRETAQWIEFRALTADRRDRWFEIQTRGLNEGDAIYGAVLKDYFKGKALCEISPFLIEKFKH